MPTNTNDQNSGLTPQSKGRIPIHESAIYKELPPGKRSLREIARGRNDPSAQVINAAVLLEFVLDQFEPVKAIGLRDSDVDSSNTVQTNTQDNQLPEGLGRRVGLFEKWIGDLSNVYFALGVRNDLVHSGSSKRDRPPTNDEIRRAADYLMDAIRAFLPHMPPNLARLVRGDTVSSRLLSDLKKSWRWAAGAAATILIYGAIVFILQARQAQLKDRAWTEHQRANQFFDKNLKYRHSQAKMVHASEYKLAAGTLDDAEQLRAKREYAQALKKYTEAINLGQNFASIAKQYDDASTARLPVQRAREKLAKSNVEALSWESGLEQAWLRGEEAFVQKQYPKAKEFFNELSGNYQTAIESRQLRQNFELARAALDKFFALTGTPKEEYRSRYDQTLQDHAIAVKATGPIEFKSKISKSIHQFESLFRDALLAESPGLAQRGNDKVIDMLADLCLKKPEDTAAIAAFNKAAVKAPHWWLNKAKQALQQEGVSKYSLAYGQLRILRATAACDENQYKEQLMLAIEYGRDLDDPAHATDYKLALVDLNFSLRKLEYCKRLMGDAAMTGDLHKNMLSKSLCFGRLAGYALYLKDRDLYNHYMKRGGVTDFRLSSGVLPLVMTRQFDAALKYKPNRDASIYKPLLIAYWAARFHKDELYRQQSMVAKAYNRLKPWQASEREYWLSRAATLAGEYDRAQQHIDRLSGTYRSHPVADLVTAYTKRGKFDEACALYDRESSNLSYSRGGLQAAYYAAIARAEKYNPYQAYLWSRRRGAAPYQCAGYAGIAEAIAQGKLK